MSTVPHTHTEISLHFDLFQDIGHIPSLLERLPILFGQENDSLYQAATLGADVGLNGLDPWDLQAQDTSHYVTVRVTMHVTNPLDYKLNTKQR